MGRISATTCIAASLHEILKRYVGGLLKQALVEDKFLILLNVASESPHVHMTILSDAATMTQTARNGLDANVHEGILIVRIAAIKELDLTERAA